MEILHVWHFVYMGYLMGISAVASMGDVEQSAQLVIDEALAEIGQAGDAVHLTGRGVEGAAAKVLLEEAANADLLVVGRRGHGGFMGLLLGSVAQQLAHHAPCPLVIVPTESDPSQPLGYRFEGLVNDQRMSCVSACPAGRTTRRSPIGR